LNKKLIQRVLENSERLVAYYKQWRAKKMSGEDFVRHHDALSIPGGEAYNLQQLKLGNPDAINMAIAFLQADPFFFRSGYLKEQLLRLLKKAPLSQEHKTALKELLLYEITRVPAKRLREYTDYCKLANAIQDNHFRKKVAAILNSSDNSVHREKARIMLDMMDSQKSLK